MSRPIATFLQLFSVLALLSCSPDPDKVCASVCSQNVECEGMDSSDLQDCTTSCTDDVASAEQELGEDCYKSELARLDCVSTLTCSDADVWAQSYPSDPGDYPCKEEDQKEAESCAGSDEGSSCDCSNVSETCTYTYDSLGNATAHCTCSPSCCC